MKWIVRLERISKVKKKFLFIVNIFAINFILSPVNALASKTSGTASVMRLEKTIGDVSVTASSGSQSQIIEKMRLNSGDDVKSASKSYAYFNLDDAKAVKLDAQSEAVIKNNKNKYEVVLESGNLLFDVEKELKGNESFEIKTSNLTMGIRGTCAQVMVKDENTVIIDLLEGVLYCVLTDPVTGNSESITLVAGDHAIFSTGPGYMNNCQIIIRKIVFTDLRGFALDYIYEDQALAQKIYEQSGIDLRYMTRKLVDDILEQDENGKTIPVNEGRPSPTAQYYLNGH